MLAYPEKKRYHCRIKPLLSPRHGSKPLLHYHGGRHRQPFLADQPPLAAQTVPRYPRHRQKFHPPYLRTLRQDHPAGELPRSDQQHLQTAGTRTPARAESASGTLRTGRTQYGPLHRLRRMAAPKRQSRRNDDRHPRRPPDPQRRGVPQSNIRKRRIHRTATCDDDHRHPAQPPRHRIRLYPDRPGTGRRPQKANTAPRPNSRPSTTSIPHAAAFRSTSA